MNTNCHIFCTAEVAESFREKNTFLKVAEKNSQTRNIKLFFKCFLSQISESTHSKRITYYGFSIWYEKLKKTKI